MNPAVTRPTEPTATAGRWLRPALAWALAWALALALLAAVFCLYFQPALLVALSEQLWACFN